MNIWLNMENLKVNDFWVQHIGNSPVIAVALHDGHKVRNELLSNMKIDDASRLREEDPFTGDWAKIAPSWVVCQYSRFEVDLNRPREKAVYQLPEDAWNLEIWKKPLTNDIVADSLSKYDRFYENFRKVLLEMEARFGRFIVFDIHSYNHMRNGPNSVPAEASENPEVNVGTGTMNRSLWSAEVNQFIEGFINYPYPRGGLDVRENIKFKGGNLARWVHEKFPDSGCVLSIEFKKFFMDEWTGQAYPEDLQAIGKALHSSMRNLEEILRRS